MGETEIVSEIDDKVIFSRSILVDFAFEIPTSLKFEVIGYGGISGTDERVRLVYESSTTHCSRSKEHVHVTSRSF